MLSKELEQLEINYRVIHRERCNISAWKLSFCILGCNLIKIFNLPKKWLVLLIFELTSGLLICYYKIAEQHYNLQRGTEVL